ncbi:MAG: outer membrane beta-barrel protein [Prevotella histicola]|jgi:hypothetical protein|uniref:Outer membrane protein beta-barrel domain-containing protein n=8 Tax=Prevotellaceae TaxID=171552 RepID=G6AFR3_9BACT|nr:MULTISPECIES: outer membrane beta-barrel protein [Bacteroidales]ANR73675.1 hypothetical protein AXF22_09345 [Prevotella scopos JCM 17725]EHG16546.1 hypothetical protein HMPREF9138_00940 [Prevotella histicola F0411]KGF46400.1 hypothetical protein HMPREF0654_11430 [Prevotella disiens DNF00882]MBF1401095.1 outer membrane beta-barrel protein [Prevotella histicola]MBF1423966.1 outer membrane beta-barrel protein [Prevotella histicola]
MIIKRILLIFIILLLLFPTANATILNLVVGDTIYPTRKHVSSLHKTIELDEVQVIGQRKLFSIRKDTTFINTDCLRVRKGANLEDLIRNIPGMEYDKANRQLSFKGKPLNGVNINGETFMGNDIIAALENMPTDAVELLKLYDMLSALEKMTGVDDGADNYVLDIKTKSTYNGSLTGTLTAEHGNRDRRRDEVQGNLFNADGENTSLTLRSDNLSNMNIGGNNFQNILSGNIVKKFGKKITLNASLSLNAFHNGSENHDYDEQYLSSGTKYRESMLLSLSKNHSNAANINLQYNIDKKTLLNISANGNFGRSDNLTDNTTYLYERNTAADTLTSGTLRNNTKSNGKNYHVSADLTRRIGKAGASFTVKATLGGNSNETNNTSLSLTKFHHLRNAVGGDSLLLRNLCQQLPTLRNESRISLQYTHPFGKQLKLQTGYGLHHEEDRNTSNTYDYTIPNRPYIDSLSYENTLSICGQELTLRMDYKGKQWKINSGIDVEWQRRNICRQHNSETVDYTVKATEYKPKFGAKWNNGKIEVELRYNGNTQQPSIQALLTLDDKSNPLSVKIGNPQLKPAYQQQLSIRLNERKYGITFMGNYHNSFNDFAEEVTYDSNTGARTYRTVNINGNYSVDGMLQWQKQVKRLMLSGTMRTSFKNHVYLFHEQTYGNALKSKTHTTGNEVSLRLNYQPKWGNIDLHASWQLYRSNNLLTNTHVNTIDYDCGISGTVELPHDIEIWGDANCHLRRGTYSTTDDDQWLLNVGASWRFLRKKQATLSFKWNDILNRRRDLNRSVSGYGYHESFRPQIHSYALVSLRYRFSLTKSKTDKNSHKQQNPNK